MTNLCPFDISSSECSKINLPLDFSEHNLAIAQYLIIRGVSAPMCMHFFPFHHLNVWESERMKINLKLSNFMETIFFFLNGQAMLLLLSDISESFLYENNTFHGDY